MNCSDPLGCPCETHVSPRTHVPCCPTHDLPLVWAPDGYGKCLAVTTKRKHNQAQLTTETEKQTCTEWGPINWNWLPRDLFNDDDLPPYNGFQPPEYHEERPMYRLDVVLRCPDCGVDTPHTEVTVENAGVVICSRCDVGRWA